MILFGVLVFEWAGDDLHVVQNKVGGSKSDLLRAGLPFS